MLKRRSIWHRNYLQLYWKIMNCCIKDSFITVVLYPVCYSQHLIRSTPSKTNTLTCTVLPSSGSQTHHTDIQHCHTVSHTSHHWSIASTAERPSSSSTDRWNWASSRRCPSRTHGCYRTHRSACCTCALHTAGCRRGRPLGVAGCCGQTLPGSCNPGCGSGGRWS